MPRALHRAVADDDMVGVAKFLLCVSSNGRGEEVGYSILVRGLNTKLGRLHREIYI